jgi:hypothetical protein
MNWRNNIIPLDKATVLFVGKNVFIWFYVIASIQGEDLDG